jgi:hypothetical protein
MIERSRELPDNVDELKALTLANAARAHQSEADTSLTFPLGESRETSVFRVATVSRQCAPVTSHRYLSSNI